MSADCVPTWTMIGTWVNAIAMACAAFFAYRAWRSQVTYSRSGEQRADRAAAVGHAAAAIADLTTGSVATARKAVADWSTDFADNPPSHRRADNDVVRGDRLVGRFANDDVRHQVFVLLWGLQRLAPLAEDVELAQPSQRRVLRAHVDLITDTLARLSAILEASETSLFRDSAAAATDSVLQLAPKLALSVEESLAWSAALSGFSLVVVAGG